MKESIPGKANKLNHRLHYILLLNYKLTLLTQYTNNAGYVQLTCYTFGQKA
jgi:hypothetical protein